MLEASLGYVRPVSKIKPLAKKKKKSREVVALGISEFETNMVYKN